MIKKGLEALPSSLKRDMAATRQVSSLPSGRSRSIGLVMAPSLSEVLRAPSSVSTQYVRNAQGRPLNGVSSTSLWCNETSQGGAHGYLSGAGQDAERVNGCDIYLRRLKNS